MARCLPAVTGLIWSKCAIAPPPRRKRAAAQTRLSKPSPPRWRTASPTRPVLPGQSRRLTRKRSKTVEERHMANYDNLLANVPTDLWIGGKWRKASDGGRFDVVDPATERKIASVASATVEDAKAALDAAEGAFEGWAGRKP